MRATSLRKQSETIDNIYKSISEANANCRFKIFIPHDVHVSDKVKSQLMEDGYKVSNGLWDGIIVNALIIEW